VILKGKTMHANPHHASKIESAAATVTEWNARIWKLREDIGKAEATLAESAHRRQQSVLDAALGDGGAKQRLEQVLADDRKAERELADLKMALPLAEAKLREAENAHRAIEVELRKTEVNRVALERLEIAKLMDKAMAEYAAAFDRYQALGRELFGLCADGTNVSNWDHIEGWSRVAKSLPAPFVTLQKRLPGVFFGGGGPLAQSEASYWGVSIIRKDAA
jgi:hypothetical protein